MKVQELIRDLLKFNMSDHVYATLVEGKPVLSVEEIVVMEGAKCDCDSCVAIANVLPGFELPLTVTTPF